MLHNKVHFGKVIPPIVTSALLTQPTNVFHPDFLSLYLTVFVKVGVGTWMIGTFSKGSLAEFNTAFPEISVVSSWSDVPKSHPQCSMLYSSPSEPPEAL